jgi:hypothetical protein
MAVRNLGLVQAIWVGTTAPTNIFMIWADVTPVGGNPSIIHKYYNTITAQWEPFIINAAILPLVRSSANILLNYNTSQFELLGGTHLSIKANVLADVTPPFLISDITGLQDALDLKVDKVAGKSLILDTEITRLSSVTNYTHPANHPPSIITQDSSNRFVTDVQIAAWDAKQAAIGYVPYDASNPSGYLTLADISGFIEPITITLPSEGSVQARVDNAVEGVDYPTGWVLYAAGDNANDLIIEHGLTKYVIFVSINSIQVGGLTPGSRMLLGNAAYSGIIAPDNDTLRIEGLATKATIIKINIIFSPV